MNYIVVTDSDCILIERTSAITIIAYVSFKTTKAADFRKEDKNTEFFRKKKPGVDGMISLPPITTPFC